MKQVQKTKQKVKANGLQTMIRDAISVLKGYEDPLTIEKLKADTGYVNERALSAALRVARRDGRVIFDGKRYSLPASPPATNAEPPPFSADGPLTRVDEEAPATPTLPSPRADARVMVMRSKHPQYFLRMVDESAHKAWWGAVAEHAHTWGSERDVEAFFLAFAEDWWLENKSDLRIVPAPAPSPRADDGGPVVLRWKRDGEFYKGGGRGASDWGPDVENAVVFPSAAAGRAAFVADHVWFTPGEEDAEFVPVPSPRAPTIVPPAALPAWVKDGTEVVDAAGERGVLAWAMGREQWAVMSGRLCLWVGDAGLLASRWAPVVKPALPAWLREGQRVRGIGEQAGKSGVLRRAMGSWAVYGGHELRFMGSADGIERNWVPVDDATLDPLAGFPAWCRLGAQPAPGFARDLAEKQAFGFTTARERIAAVLTRAGLTEATAAQPGIIVRVERDGRIGLRWGVKHADGSTASCAWTEHAERLMERASNALHNAGYKASVGAPEERAARPSEAAERVAALEAKLAAERTAREEAVEREVAAETRRAFAEKHLDRALRILETVVERRAS